MANGNGNDSQRPAGMSGIFPRSSSAADLHAASTNQARVIDSYLATFKASNARIRILEDHRGRIETRVDKLEDNMELAKVAQQTADALRAGMSKSRIALLAIVAGAVPAMIDLVVQIRFHAELLAVLRK